MNRAHAAPILAALNSSGAPALRVFDGSVDARTVPPYLVAYISTTAPEATSLEEPWDKVTCTAVIHYVGSNAAACRVLADRGWAALLGLTPEIDGRDCGPIRLVDSQPPRRDESTGQLIVDQVDVFEYASLPNAA